MTGRLKRCEKILGRELREGDLHEIVQGRTVFVDLGLQHRALPCVDDERRQRLGGEVLGDRAGLLRLADHMSNLIAPCSKRPADALANERALIGQLSCEISQQTPGRELVLGHGFVGALKIFTQPLQRGQPRVPQDAPTRLPLFLVLQHDLCGQRFLALEVVVEGPLWSARRLGDVLDAGGVEPLVVQGVEAGGKELLAQVGPRHAPYMTGRLGIVNLERASRPRTRATAPLSGRGPATPRAEHLTPRAPRRAPGGTTGTWLGWIRSPAGCARRDQGCSAPPRGAAPAARGPAPAARRRAPAAATYGGGLFRAPARAP